MLKNEIQQLNAQITELHRQHTDELDQLSCKNTSEVQKLLDELARQKESYEADSHENGKDLVYYRRYFEAVEHIDELQDTVSELQTEVKDLQEQLQCRDAEVEQLKTNISSRDADSGDVVAAIQLDLERVSAERSVLIT